MTKTTILCDKCGDKAIITMPVIVDRQLDASGSIDDIEKNLDMCECCCKAAIGQLLESLIYRQRLNWYTQWGGK